MARTRARKEGICPSRIGDGRWPTFLATGFGVGTAPVAPGTLGTLLGVPVFLALTQASPMLYVGTVVMLFIIGVPICQTAIGILGRDDHPAIVWDEIVGYLITMFAAPGGWAWVVIGVLLFRLFDIWKPFPIRALERRLSGGLGTMADDVLAGVYGLVALQLIAWGAARAGML